MGGIDNSAEELERTSRVLAGIIADLYWESQEVKKAGAVAKAENPKNPEKANNAASPVNKKS
ncbi:hypothetical protein D3C76_1812620 [compost metagenome]